MATDKLAQQLASRASGSNMKSPAVPATPKPATAVGKPRPPVVAMRAAPPTGSCQQTLTLSFFFDGTGNNLDADLSTWEHSNVARLYRAHLLDDDAVGRYRFYLPGIGTYFKDREVQDSGDTTLGKAFGSQGQARLDFAFARLHEKVKEAEARAKNPTNKVCWIKVNVFGFSRGAALARAFCRDLQKRCVEDGNSTTGWCLKPGYGGHPIEITFAGLFDTVASAGLLTSVNNLRRKGWIKAVEWVTNSAGKLVESLIATPELKALAFGSPGADPAPGLMDGHASWANGLAIEKLVKRSVHMMAAHEMRNSFPVDSALAHMRTEKKGNITYIVYEPREGCNEYVYPGAHSDVGGGYRPGESGCRPEAGAQLSLIALRNMHPAAIAAGVPLVPFSNMTQVERKDFALDEASAAEFAKMAELFNYYQAQLKSYDILTTGWNTGNEFNRNMRAYYAWRFHNIRNPSVQRSAAAAQERNITPSQRDALAVMRNATPQSSRATAQEKTFSKDRDALDAELKNARIDVYNTTNRLARAGMALQSAQSNSSRTGSPLVAERQQQYDEAKLERERAQINYDKLRARRATAADDSGFNKLVSKFNRVLLNDAKQLVQWMREDKSLVLRPHYKALVDAYLDEYENNKGMRDAKLIAFFDDYVHDSLGGFDETDQTWPSDPRIIYVGADSKMSYAVLDKKPAQHEETEMA